MWSGLVTPRLRRLAAEYKEKFGISPDSYDDIGYEGMPYFEFLILIKMALRLNVEIPNLFGDDEE